MSYKVKSFIYLSCFIAAFTIYNFSVFESNNTYSDKSEIAIAKLDKVEKVNNLPTKSPK